jgi:hypothetical protein
LIRKENLRSTAFRLRGCYLLWLPFPEAFGYAVLLRWRTAVPPGPSRYTLCATPAGLTRIRFGLFPLRSPLLGESRLISLPRATKMFQFARLPPTALCVQTVVSPHYGRWVAPFGYPRVIACLQLTVAVSLLATPFFGSQCQGILRAPFLAWPQSSRRCDPLASCKLPVSLLTLVYIQLSTMQLSRCLRVHSLPAATPGGDDRARTGDLLRAWEALSQLSYVPSLTPHRGYSGGGPRWNRTTDLALIRGALLPTELPALTRSPTGLQRLPQKAALHN